MVRTFLKVYEARLLFLFLQEQKKNIIITVKCLAKVKKSMVLPHHFQNNKATVLRALIEWW
jgi:hypothetical protein